MKFKTFGDYWHTLTADEKRDLADRADTSVKFLANIANGHREPGRDIMIRLYEADENIVLEMLI